MTTALQVYAHRLGDPNLSANLKVTIANELRDQVEVFQTVEYAKFLSTLIPVFLDILNKEPPVFVSNAPEQKLRNIILEIIYRLPQIEALKEYVPDLCRTLMNVLRNENEDNGVVCVKIIIDLHRSFRQVLEDQVQPFMDIVQEIFQNMEQAVKDAFDNAETPAPAITPGPTPFSVSSPRPMSPAAEIPDAPSKTLPRSMYSFKVLTECPIIVVLLFQSYRRCAEENISRFIPLIFQTLSLQAKPQMEAEHAAQERDEVFIGVSSGIRNRSVYNDFIVAQVKTMSFLAYILRSYTALLRPYQHQVPDFVLRLLRECPSESSAIRKELLVATRHILSTDLRTLFVPKIDLLLNEKVLIGSGITAHDTLRPLAYSMLADLIHHIRAELSPIQLSRTIYMYSRNLHDSTLAPSIQTMCGKLLLNLIDCIMKLPNKSQGRELLMRILEAFASKFEALNVQFDSCLRQYKKKQNSETMDVDDNDFDFEKARSIHSTMYMPDNAHDGIKDGRFLFKNLAIGLKPLFIGLRNCNPPPSPTDVNAQTNAQYARGFSRDDVELLIRLFREGLKCFEYYNVDNYGDDGSLPDYNELQDNSSDDGWSVGSGDSSLKLSMQPQNGEKDVLDTFPIVFTFPEPAVFQELFVSQMEFFFDRMLINTSLLQIAQYFLVNEVTTQGFTGILLRFLVDRIEQLGDDNTHYSDVMLHVFRLAFMAVNLYPDMNEAILQPYLANLVMSCFKLAAKAKQPVNYFLLLRALFKSIGGGRFELLYKEVSPLMQIILENLNSLLTLAHKPEMRNLLVELCLAVPVRLSILLPYLPYLMRPLVIALQGDADLVSQGLRTMELCNDNLNADFLDHIMAPVMTELMDALWKHLQPLPYNEQHSHAAMRILGKLGGRNRRMLKNPPKLKYDHRAEQGVAVEFVFDSSSYHHTLSLDRCMEVALKTLNHSDVDVIYKQNAFKFIKANLVLMLDLSEGTDDLAQGLYQRVKEYLSEQTEERQEVVNNDDSSVVGSALESTMHPKRLPGNGYTRYMSARLAQEDALRTMLVSIMTASTVPELSDEAWAFFQHVCNHFILLHIGEAIEAREKGRKPLAHMMDERLNVQHLNTILLVEAIVEVMESEYPSLRKRGEQALKHCFDVAVRVFGNEEHVPQLPIFRVFASQFCSCCYKQEWHRKRGGCLGISIMTSQLAMGTKWMREHELDFVRSLLFVLKDASPDMANINTSDATQTLSHVLKVCNVSEDGESSEAQQKFQNLIALLLSELSNSNSVVRETIQSSFQLLADLTGNEVTELLAPVRERLVAPIFAKPLRALPFAMQIGHIDAITYCLTLRPPFLEFNDELTRLLHEALALADAEDQALVSRSSQYKNTTSLMNLRIVCIKLLSAAMACSDFSGQRQTNTRARIIQVFFKSLYSKSPEVVEAAHRGLKQVLTQQHKLPKELLQQGLRPILTTLSNHKTLSITGLEGLARLLELLTNYFKVEIGKKLLDHMKQWAEPKVLQDASSKPLTESHEIKIIVAILNIFHLLPAAADMFLDELVTAVLDMEEHLRRSVSSPFRPNLIKYLNRYPAKTVVYFYDRLDNYRFSRLFISILEHDSASQLRDEVSRTTGELNRRTLQIQDNIALRYQGVLIANAQMAYSNDWLAGQPDVLSCLIDIWRLPGRFDMPISEDRQDNTLMRETICIAKLFVSHLRNDPSRVELIFDLVVLFTQEALMDLSFLQKFLTEDMALKYTGAQKRGVLDAFLHIYSDASVSSYRKMMALRQVICPMLLVALSRNEYGDILDASMMEQLDQKIWANLLLDSPDSAQYTEDSLRIELLQLIAMIVQYSPQLLHDRRKEVIKFGWNYLKLEDATSKQSAYVLIAHFIAAYDTPSTIAIRVYGALLRAHASEARALVKQGLDILAPILPKRVPLQNNERVPAWVRLTRKVVVEDTHSISQMVNVYQLLIRHPDLFYEYREHFLPQIVSTLPKLGLLQNATPEHKVLTVELGELILKWERRRLSEAQTMDVDEAEASPLSPEKRAMEEDDGGSPRKKMLTDGAESKPVTPHAQKPASETPESSTDTSASKGTSFVPSPTLRENVIGYLVRLSCLVMPTDLIQRRLVQRSLDLIKDLLSESVWPDVNVKLMHLERTMLFREVNEVTVSGVCSALQIIHIDLLHRPSDWILEHAGQLQRLLEPSIRSENTRVHTALYPVMVRMMDVLHANMPEENPPADATAFLTLVNNTIQEGLNSMSNIFGVLKLLEAASNSSAGYLDPFVPGVVKMLQILTKEHTMPTQSTPSKQYDMQVNLLVLGLYLLRKRISHLGDQRRWFLTCLIQLIEKSPDVQLLSAIMDMIRGWVLDSTDMFPTIKEKAGLLGKMMTLETRNNPQLTESFLDLVMTIYRSPQFARSDLTVRLEQAFLLGTRSSHVETRMAFMDVFDKSIGQVLYTRLNYILGVQNWEPLANTFWIHQALDLLLGTIQVDPEAASPCRLKVKSLQSVGQAEESVMDDVPDELSKLVVEHQAFLRDLQEQDANVVIKAAQQLQYLDDEMAFALWVDLFRTGWTVLGNRERHDLSKLTSTLLAKVYHEQQAEQRPNVIQALLVGASKTVPPMKLSHLLIKNLGMTYGAWHTAIEMLQRATVIGSSRVSSSSSKEDETTLVEAQDALAELYWKLQEHDMFYGLWRRRCKYIETNLAVSFEQSGMWMQAQNMYEHAQIKARGGVLPLTQSECLLWEDHWVMCTQKLQQWDILTDLAKHDGNINLLLECAWRLSDWTAEREILEQSLHQLPPPPTPRQKVFEGFISLIKSQTSQESLTDFSRICEEGVQLSLREWHTLPSIVSQSHLPLLRTFQQFLELQEASQIFKSLMNTTLQNLDQRSNELGNILSTWRERLPNTWDDINVWSDLVAWRQHIFSAINRTYLPLIPLMQPSNNGKSASNNSCGYRGYHETAWIINRFAHVARKHHLHDVCINYLTKIYTLPNIEIQEAFLKLREQAKCYYQNTSELTAGLDVITNTNLMYFSPKQKAEFFALKGMFLAKMHHNNEANEAFVNAVQIDMLLPRAWAEWGRYNDRRFKENPKMLTWASHAVSCYLQAAGLYKNAKTRKYLLRILWLLSLDDAAGTVSRAIEGYKGEWPVWYWITFIPQLLMALQYKESRHARAILIRIAKLYPQALHFQLRTAKEEFQKRQMTMTALQSNNSNGTPSTPGTAATAAAAAVAAAAAAAAAIGSSSTPGPSTTIPMTTLPTRSQTQSSADGDSQNAMAVDNSPSTPQDGTESSIITPVKEEPKYDAMRGVETTEDEKEIKDQDSAEAKAETPTEPQTTMEGAPVTSSASDTSATMSATMATPTTTMTPTNGAPGPLTVATGMNVGNGAIPKTTLTPTLPGVPNMGTLNPLDEIMSVLKTAYPLLALSMETMVDQIQLKFKPQADEDMYRLVVALYNEGAQQLLIRLTNSSDNLQLTQATVANIERFAKSLYPGHMRTAFVNDFANCKLNLEEYVARLRLWRDKFEAMLDARPRKQKLEASSHYLVEFQHQKFDDVEIPGQYLLLMDNANDFLRIDRFLPEVEVIRSYGNCYRRLTIRGSDGSLHPFLIQNPVARQFRREERLMQLFRMLNHVLERRKESRMRNLSFYLPAIVPLAPNVRMVQDDPSYVSLLDVYEDHCDNVQMHKDDPLVYFIDRFKRSVETHKEILIQKMELLNLRMDMNDYIATHLVPSDILTRYMLRAMGSFTDYYMLRKQFTSQYAAATFMTYILSIGHRMPHKITISRSTGNLWMTELLPGWNQTTLMFGNGEAIPFRLTPNIQDFMTPVGIEGQFASCLMATARCLSEPEFDLEQYLGLFVRDELSTWLMASHRTLPEADLRDTIQANIQEIVNKAQFLSCKADRDKQTTNTPATATASGTSGGNNTPNGNNSNHNNGTSSSNSTKPVNQNVIDLISRATNTQRMAQMECTWMPWL